LKAEDALETKPEIIAVVALLQYHDDRWY
jgi:hypothetical protein